MLGSGILETIIGLVFVFLLVSMLVTVVNELIAAVLLSRAKWLRIGIERLLESDWAQRVYDHPLIDGTAAVSTPGKTGASRIRGSGPSYIASRSFANVLFDLLRRPSDTAPVSAIQQRIQAVLDSEAGDGTIDRLKEVISAVKVDFPQSRVAAAVTSDLELVLPQLQARIAAVGYSASNANNANNAGTDGGAGRVVAPYTVRSAIADVQRFIDAMPMRYVRELITDVPQERLRRTLLVLLDDAQGDVEKFKQNVEIWFNNAMDRVGGWYKRRSQFVALLVSLIAVVSLNVDSVVIARHLQTFPGVRDALVAQARSFAATPLARAIGNGAAAGKEEPTAAAPSQPVIADAALRLGASTGGTPDAGTLRADADLPAQFTSVESQLNQLALPIGWVKQATTQIERDAMLELPGNKVSWEELMKFHVLGWLITVLAASLGAPFWFDTLNRIMSIRSAGKAPEEMPKPPKEVPLPLEPGQTPVDAAIHPRG